MLNESTVDAGQVDVVDSQVTETPVVEEVVTDSSEVVETESESSEVATEPVKEVQSQDDNAKYADVRRKAEQAGRDKFISDQYGKSHNIHTEAEYKAAIAKQEQEKLEESVRNGESDPKDAFEQWKANDPEFQAMKQSKEESYANEQISTLNNELKELGIDTTINSLEDIVNLDNSDDVINYVEKGMTLSEAYFLANKQSILQKDRTKIQQDTIKQIEANGSSAVGSLSDTGETASLFTEAQVDAMSQADVNKNLDLIYKSMKSW